MLVSIYIFKIFDDYCTLVGIDVEHLIPQVHIQKWIGKIID